MQSPHVHVVLTQKIKGVKVVQKGTLLLISLAQPLVVGPLECKMVIPPFRVTGNIIQLFSVIC